MNGTLSSLVRKLDDAMLAEASVIPWSSPVPSFGDLARSTFATLGLNPSNREFVDSSGNELVESQRRFHTLGSLGLRRWSQARQKHLSLIEESCRSYFMGNPYDTWFRKLDYLLGGTGATYYGVFRNACHLDLIPYATAKKWTELQPRQREALFGCGAEALGRLVKESPVKLLVLNGRSVVEQFESVAEVKLERKQVHEWALPRKSGEAVPGYSYVGVVRQVAGIKLGRELAVVGYNHNIQSSFGVTKGVVNAIRSWLAHFSEKNVIARTRKGRRKAA